MEKVIVAVDQTNYDKACEALGNFLEKYAMENEPVFIIDNDGIGEYEYWGARGFDNGTNYAVIEDDKETVFEIDCSGMPEDFREDFASPFNGETYGFFNKYEKGVRVTLHFTVSNCAFNGSKFTFTGKWED